MYPISLDVTKIRIALVGHGDAFTRRLAALHEAGAQHVTAYTDLPHAHEIRQAHVLMVVGLDEETSAVLAGIARLQGILVNVEDNPDLCDFYFMSFVKRGDLALAVSTNGASPTLAQEIKAYLTDTFGEEWEDTVAQIAAQRLAWKREGLSNTVVGERSRAWLAVHAPAPLGHSEGMYPHPYSLPEGEGVDMQEHA
jgi:siroheme synthase (precorrin-2 oxidase/ferrochelatase)